jgi:hypothetical protein
MSSHPVRDVTIRFKASVPKDGNARLGDIYSAVLYGKSNGSRRVVLDGSDVIVDVDGKQIWVNSWEEVARRREEDRRRAEEDRERRQRNAELLERGIQRVLAALQTARELDIQSVWSIVAESFPEGLGPYLGRLDYEVNGKSTKSVR